MDIRTLSIEKILLLLRALGECNTTATREKMIDRLTNYFSDAEIEKAMRQMIREFKLDYQPAGRIRNGFSEN